MLDQQLLDILVCPKCKGDLRFDQEPPSLVCEACSIRYEVRDGIPILLIDEATPL
ncbi:MAG TPA: Trm112 family protein [Longimicrobiaceae bacterium]|nr:Trm112 family protein [Longimicrobiaceae bacterium]